MKSGMMALLSLLLAATEVMSVGLTPVRPYRAWCWNAHQILSDHPALYKGVNLDLLPGGGSNATVAQIENQHGIATLHYAEGAEEPWYGQLKVRSGQAARNGRGLRARACIHHLRPPVPVCRPTRPARQRTHPKACARRTIATRWPPLSEASDPARPHCQARRRTMRPSTSQARSSTSGIRTRASLFRSLRLPMGRRGRKSTQPTIGLCLVLSFGQDRVDGAITLLQPSLATSRRR